MDVFGLIGNPVGHSLSPPMHEAAYDALEMDARYVTFEPDPDAIEDAIDGAAALGVTGLNVTIPFKQDALECVEADPLASRIGAVNTIDFTGERPTGHNTDAGGALRSLRDHDVAVDGERAVVVGAGGAGRAIAFGLADADATVEIANRTESTAHELADDVPGATGHGLESGTLADLLADADILVNATSVGMDDGDETPVPAAALHGELAVLDAVYSPLETRLLREAADAGATTIDGAWMLLYQGVEAFEHWTGRDAPVDAMNDALRSRL
ncbi:shikimate dehydrogenase [Natronolimnohabitans innermongolicus]|uniref:Shikimate dehydrogenase (NADP(+)) n=1 Tax=Natronolimnohabitans innermongolicus JCM 12255 TaxID=1227499 RepID=L9XHS0_9EURY|nr:shikimate dehydrogenase [Natronolimnohabitans innermongolicus]ELY61289.1 shikimate 5-dehydrogenase [Natronolimnohabitans innermongolicus JCM 12255]